MARWWWQLPVWMCLPCLGPFVLLKVFSPWKAITKKFLQALSFSANGSYLATGVEDTTCRIWDLRKKEIHIHYRTLQAHITLSQVKFEPQKGHFLVYWFV